MDNKYERIIEERALSDLSGVNTFFKRLSGIDPDQVPEKYGDCVSEARKVLGQNCTAKVVYQRLVIKSNDGTSVTIGCNPQVDETSDDCGSEFTLKGEMAAKVLSASSELYAFVATIAGYENIPTDDIMLEYMMDTWGSAYTECIQAEFANHISEIATDEGMIRTHVWCPGQFKFDLKNQTTLFDILRPEDIGCRLTERLMMVPVKSASGIIGLVSGNTAELIKPCDYCQHRSTCPSSNKGCAAL